MESDCGSSSRLGLPNGLRVDVFDACELFWSFFFNSDGWPQLGFV